jgi:alkylated DNA repair dioxygenase AlkB
MHESQLQVIFRENHEALEVYPGLFSSFDWKKLSDQLNWKQNQIRMFGKIYPEPRLTAWYGLPYTYSGIHWPQQEMTSELQYLREEIERITRFSFNSVLANCYRSGNDSMGWHRDNEPEMDQSLIASVSFGSERRFLIREKKGTRKFEIPLGSGTLLLMHHMQERWEHAIPKTAKESSVRINLTFRKIRWPEPAQKP